MAANTALKSCPQLTITSELAVAKPEPNFAKLFNAQERFGTCGEKKPTLHPKPLNQKQGPIWICHVLNGVLCILAREKRLKIVWAPQRRANG